MGYILLGQGDLDVDSSVTPADMEFVAIPEGTTVRFYTSSGDCLVYGAHRPDIWRQLQAPWPRLDSSRVTYNLTLYGNPDGWAEDLENDPQFGEHTVVLPGRAGVPDPVRMCSGTRATCPTDPRDVAAGAAHTCDGVLATYAGDLYWLACSALLDAESPAAADRRPG